MPVEPTTAAPPRWERLPEGYEAWLITRYDDVRQVLSDTRLTRDPVRAAAARMDALANSLVDRFVADGRADLVSQYALPLTVSTLCEFAGIPFQDWEGFDPWVQAVHVVDPTPEGGRRIGEAAMEMNAYFEELVAGRLDQLEREPLDSDDEADVLTSLVAGRRDAVLDPDDLLAMGRSILVGGYESTKSLIVTGMYRLLVDPDQLEAVRADPARVSHAVEEFLRYDPPFPRLQERYALEDVEIGGVVIGKGEPVVIDLVAANRDPDRFERAAELDVTVLDRGHLAFGPGVHHCLGASPARLEADVAITTLLARLSDVALDVDPEQLDWQAGIITGPARLPVRFTPAARTEPGR